MASLFSFSLFKEQLREELSVFEFSFLKRVFSQAALSFGVFGLLVCSLTALSEAKWAEGFFGRPEVIAFAIAISLISGLALMFYYLPKYHRDPLSVHPKFVKRAYLTLILTYGFVFCVALRGISFLANWNQGIGILGSSTVIGIVLFGSTLLVYLVPATIGLMMKKHSKAVKLSGFLKKCYLAYMVLFGIALVGALVGTGGTMIEMSHFLLMLLFGVIVFVSPILSVYRMKIVARFLDRTDFEAIKKWELFFVFEILVQLMQMAIYLVRIACSVLAGGIISNRRE